MDAAWHKKSLPRLAGEVTEGRRGGKEPAKPPLGGFSPHDGVTKEEKRRDVACNVSKARVAAVKPSNDAAWQLYPPFRPSGTFPRKRGKGKVPDWRTQYLYRLSGVGWASAHRGVACFLRARQARPSSRVITQFSCFLRRCLQRLYKNRQSRRLGMATTLSVCAPATALAVCPGRRSGSGRPPCRPIIRRRRC